MKRTSIISTGGGSLRIRRFLTAGKTFVVISLCSTLLFLLAGAFSMIREHQGASSLKGLASAVSTAFFADMLGMELPSFRNPADSSFSNRQLGGYMMEKLTEVNPSSPRSLLAAGIPGMPGAAGTDSQAGGNDGQNSDPAQGGTSNVEEPGPDDQPDGHDAGADDGSGEGTGVGPVGELPEEPAGNNAGENSPDKPSQGEKAVFIYQTHSRESFAPELNDGKDDPQSDKLNVGQVGARLAEQLEKKGVGTIHSDADYPTEVKGYSWPLSYKYSRKTVQEAMSTDQGLKYFIDIHRDSQKRKLTTKTINGVVYAKVFFVIGKGNPNWKQNEAFAQAIHDGLEKSYPGLSRGILGKSSNGGRNNGEYNQSLSANSILIEVGGVDNTLEECYRTAQALAEVIADIYFKDQKA
ncbi:stage II sporulation protein P [Paenibacillus pasadenensis]|uniref:stage II sporulation protein P n=1 Tax=Paenibacillus pasadenensis TaxID=217090 RepID=UPI0020411D1C|nr:stage II sporulation protein P [Paenibacillus pasadenensis]MCM3746440.1 stage II sporulation protein P [Paenibacillus pasadenensis]